MSTSPTVSLLDVDRELSELLSAERLLRARSELVVTTHRLDRGPLDASRISVAAPRHLGILVISGMLSRDIVMPDTVSTELIGPGDFIRPWALYQPARLIPHEVQWTVLAESAVALLDRRFATRLGSYPEVMAVLVDRLAQRIHRLGMMQAIGTLNRVDQRLMALFWQLAERWGRVTPDGIVIPMTLSHRMLGQLVGARRPTVSGTLSRLAADGSLKRLPDGTWLLTASPPELDRVELERVIPPRRRFVAQAPGEAEGLSP